MPISLLVLQNFQNSTDISINQSIDQTTKHHRPSSFDYKFPSVASGAPTYLITTNPSLANFLMERTLQLFVNVNNVHLFYFCCRHQFR